MCRSVLADLVLPGATWWARSSYVDNSTPSRREARSGQERGRREAQRRGGHTGTDVVDNHVVEASWACTCVSVCARVCLCVSACVSACVTCARGLVFVCACEDCDVARQTREVIIA